jgi:RNA recognition motif-containing protein
MNGFMLGKRQIRTNWAIRQKGETRTATYEEILKAGEGSNASVYLKNVGEVSEADIRESFKKFGEIKQVRLFSSKNYGFVVFDTKENAARSILEMSGQKIKGHVINCSWGRVNEVTFLCII